MGIPHTEGAGHTSAPRCPPPSTEDIGDYLKQSGAYRSLQRQREELIKFVSDKWQTSWDTKNFDRDPIAAQTARLLFRGRLDLQADLAEAKSSLAI